MELPTHDDRPIWDVWTSVYQMPSLTAADELGLFDALDEGPASVEELAGRLELNPVALKVLLPLLTSLNLLILREGRYQLSEAARLYLRKDSPLYWGHAFHIYRKNSLVPRILAVLKSKPTGALGLFGETQTPADSWASGEIDPQLARMLSAFMHSHSHPAALGLARSGLLDGVNRLLDVGGGSACFSIALAQQYPELRCTMMDLPIMCELAQDYIDAGEVGARVTTQAVDMFRQDWPGGHDAVLMSNIFHDWDAKTCAKLALSAYAALLPGGRLCLHEMLMNDDGSGPLSASLFGMQMLVGTKGRQYSAAELSELLQGAGFIDVQARPAYGYFSLVTAFKR